MGWVGGSCGGGGLEFSHAITAATTQKIRRERERHTDIHIDSQNKEGWIEELRRSVRATQPKSQNN